jgi:hypothetical protein
MLYPGAMSKCPAQTRDAEKAEPPAGPVRAVDPL